MSGSCCFCPGSRPKRRQRSSCEPQRREVVRRKEGLDASPWQGGGERDVTPLGYGGEAVRMTDHLDQDRNFWSFPCNGIVITED